MIAKDENQLCRRVARLLLAPEDPDVRSVADNAALWNGREPLGAS